MEPFPEGTTDIDTLEAGWPYVDAGKIVIYGSIDPYPNILEKLMEFQNIINAASASDFLQPPSKKLLSRNITKVKRNIRYHLYEDALSKLQTEIVTKINSYNSPSKTPNKNNLIQNIIFFNYIFL